ncbi:MAG: hypothetical protein SGPRY_008190 [Prymnesium sp.]
MQEDRSKSVLPEFVRREYDLVSTGRALMLVPLPAPVGLSVVCSQDGVVVNTRKWCSLTYKPINNKRLDTMSFTLRARKHHAIPELIVSPAPSWGPPCERSLCSLLAGAVGNYRESHRTDSEWFLTRHSRVSVDMLEDVPFTDYFIQCSHNTFVLGWQIQLNLTGGQTVFLEAIPLALNLGYRSLELDVWGDAPSQSMFGVLSEGREMVAGAAAAAASVTTATASRTAAHIEEVGRHMSLGFKDWKDNGRNSLDRVRVSRASRASRSGSPSKRTGSAPATLLADVRDVQLLPVHDSTGTSGCAQECSNHKIQDDFDLTYPAASLGEAELSLDQSNVTRHDDFEMPSPSEAAIVRERSKCDVNSHDDFEMPSPSKAAILRECSSFESGEDLELSHLSVSPHIECAQEYSLFKCRDGLDTGDTENSEPVFSESSNPCASPSTHVVRHGHINAFSNPVQLRDMLNMALRWMEAEEAACALDRLRMPLMLSIENKQKSDEGERDMARVFQSVFGERLVSPEVLSANVTLRQVAATKRRVIIKSGSYKGTEMGAREWAEIVAIWKAPGAQARGILPPNAMAKVYPPKVFQNSQNFNPLGGFDAGASLISLNMQGHATSRRARLSGGQL